MIARRAPCLLLSLLLAAPAAAQVRALPAEAATAPLSVGRAAIPSSSLAPSLSAPSFAPSLEGTPVFSAPSAAAAPAPSLAASAAAAGSAAAAAPARALPAGAAPAAEAPAPNGATRGAARRFSAADRRAAAAFSPRTKEALAAGDVSLDRLFDGRAALAPLPAAQAGPQAVPAAERALAPSSRLLRRTGRVLKAAVPLAAVGTVALAAVSPHLALAGVHALGQASYWLANPLAFLFTVPQLHRMLSRRSAEVSSLMTTIGLFSALVTTLCFAFDGKDLMMYRNLAQTAGFAAMLGLETRYARSKGRPAPSRKRALFETGALVLAFAAVMALAGPVLMTAIPSVAFMKSLLVPFQILSGFGFTCMMYAQLKKMDLEHSAGDSSAGMMWAYLGTKVIWVWSFATMLSLVAAPAWLTLATGAAFAGACWLATRYALSRLLRSSWTFLPEKLVFRGRTLTRRVLGDAVAFAALSALIVALSGLGYLAFASLLGIAGAAPLFAMYLLYTVQNLVAAIATSKTLSLQVRIGREAVQVKP